MVKASSLTKDFYRATEIGKMVGKVGTTIVDYYKQGLLELTQPTGGWYYASREEVLRFLEQMGMLENDLERQSITALYARVSSQDQVTSGDLDRQISTLIQETQGIPVEVFKDTGSGLNDKRVGLNKLFDRIISKEIQTVVVTDKDRLTRFGFNYLETFFGSYGTTIRVLNEDSDATAQQELVDDMMGLIASFSGRFYGLRSAEKRRARAVIEELEDG